jgi:hypothetical protein
MSIQRPHAHFGGTKWSTRSLRRETLAISPPAEAGVSKKPGGDSPAKIGGSGANRETPHWACTHPRVSAPPSSAHAVTPLGGFPDLTVVTSMNGGWQRLWSPSSRSPASMCGKPEVLSSTVTIDRVTTVP